MMSWLNGSFLDCNGETNVNVVKFWLILSVNSWRNSKTNKNNEEKKNLISNRLWQYPLEWGDRKSSLIDRRQVFAQSKELNKQCKHQRHQMASMWQILINKFRDNLKYLDVLSRFVFLFFPFMWKVFLEFQMVVWRNMHAFINTKHPCTTEQRHLHTATTTTKAQTQIDAHYERESYSQFSMSQNVNKTAPPPKQTKSLEVKRVNIALFNVIKVDKLC